jgi:TetR/AcrR family transcriptional regulator
LPNPDFPAYNLTNWLINGISFLFFMSAAAAKPRLGSRGRPEQSRTSILRAAVQEFSREGIAGARIDAIARSAKVNKALLYYYFKDKEALYGAVLDHVFGDLTAAVLEALSQPVPPRERLKLYVRTHFDYIACHPLYPRIVQEEMMRAGRPGGTQLERVVKQYFRPLFVKLTGLLKEGQSAGDFRAVDPIHFIPSMISVIIFYFNSAPVMRVMRGVDPYLPEHLQARRASVLDFISTALFRRYDDPSRGETK